MRSANGEVPENGKRVAEILAEMKAEVLEFVQTRTAMLRTELREKWKTLRVAIPLAGVAAMLLSTAFLLLTGALVGLVAAAFPNSVYRWVFACLIVAVFWGILGAAAVYFAIREFQLRGIIPQRTWKVLKADKLWIETEVRNRV